MPFFRKDSTFSVKSINEELKEMGIPPFSKEDVRDAKKLRKAIERETRRNNRRSQI